MTSRILLTCLLLSAVNALPAAQGDDELFVRRIQPLLTEKCISCHGSDENELGGSLKLLSRDALLKGGESGKAAVIPGRPDDSPLMLAVERSRADWSPMPPKEADRLSELQVKWLRQWIEAGASWPDSKRIEEIKEANGARWTAEDGVLVATSAGLSESWNQRRYAPDALWAYQPVVKPQVSQLGSAAIDELIERALPAGMTLAGPATAAQFIRRATYDLTGLPPSDSEIAQFEEAYARNADWAVERLINQLLSSPHYGERLAQHWLDVVRYADSSGFSNDYERGTAWRYRDYVVRAFNNDKPFDRFIVEQIAGDELDDQNPEMLIATGFLRMGPWELTGMEVARIARQRFLDDVTNSVGETFMAHSLQCARCHDHKFDPIPTRDYYSLQAVFAGTQLVDRPAEFLPEENKQGFDEARYLEQTRAEYQVKLAELEQKSLDAVDAWFAGKQLDDSQWKAAIEKANKQSASAKRRGGVFGAARAILLRDGVPEDKFPPRMLGWTPVDIGMERIASKGLERLAWQFDRYQPIAMSVINGPTPEVTAVTSPLRMSHYQKSAPMDAMHVLLGGDPFSRGERVQPGVLTALTSLGSVRGATNGSQEKWSDTIPDTLSGRRLALARWISHPHNPLTARTIVNRVWMWHFEQPLAGNPNNFGSTGARPTHPQLLDWLAASLVERNWSIKALHRLIMNSAAYRRSATFANNDPAMDRDREKWERHLAIFKARRLTAEEIRDSMLAATHELNRTSGGIPNRPEINQDIAMQPRQVMGTFAAAWTANPLPAQRHRRSLYALKLRGLVDPDQEVFNAPTADFSCERRAVSTVTTQAFTLMNGQFSQLRSIALANLAVQQKLDEPATVRYVWQSILGRQPNEHELKQSVKHWREATTREESHAVEPMSVSKSVERAVVEENTGERFTYTETLASNADFVPDLQWSDCNASTRGLAHLCLVLFNSNEFLYVY